jgi:hypothetical protein
MIKIRSSINGINLKIVNLFILESKMKSIMILVLFIFATVYASVDDRTSPNISVFERIWTNLFVIFGQFLSHDIALTANTKSKKF